MSGPALGWKARCDVKHGLMAKRACFEHAAGSGWNSLVLLVWGELRGRGLPEGWRFGGPELPWLAGG
eukprot:1173864-Rhodomonas_salina.1